MKERLIELLKDCPDIDTLFGNEWGEVADYLIENGVVVPPCKVGSVVYVTPDNCKHFHKAIIYGVDENGHWLVFVNDNLLSEEDRHIVANPIRRCFYDWFINVYTKEEAEQKLKGGAE